MIGVQFSRRWAYDYVVRTARTGSTPGQVRRRRRRTRDLSGTKRMRSCQLPAPNLRTDAAIAVRIHGFHRARSTRFSIYQAPAARGSSLQHESWSWALDDVPGLNPTWSMRGSAGDCERLDAFLTAPPSRRLLVHARLGAAGTNVRSAARTSRRNAVTFNGRRKLLRELRTSFRPPYRRARRRGAECDDAGARTSASNFTVLVPRPRELHAASGWWERASRSTARLHGRDGVTFNGRPQASVSPTPSSGDLLPAGATTGR